MTLEVAAPEINFSKNNLVPTQEEMWKIIQTPQLEEICARTGDNIRFHGDETSAQLAIGSESRPWFRYQLRERKYDGIESGQFGARMWSHPEDRIVYGPAVEESTYWLDPAGDIRVRFSPELAAFMINPFEALPFADPSPDNLKAWLEQWYAVITLDPKDRVYPGQYSSKQIPGQRRHILNESLKLLEAKGYRTLTAVPTWFHSSEMYEHLGFNYTHERDAAAVTVLASALSSEDKVTRSWRVVRQFWAQLAESQGLVPEELLRNSDRPILRDTRGNLLTFPLTPDRNLWMERKIA